MCEPISNEELEALLNPIPELEQGLVGTCVGWPIIIYYQTFCSRLVSFGFSETKLAQAKAALIEAELSYRFFGKKQGRL